VNPYPVSDVFTVVTQSFAEKNRIAIDYFKTRQWDNQTVGQVLAWMDDNQAPNEDAARHFLATFPDLWMSWVGPDVAAKVKAAL
ncbi:MAG: ABC transporter substrate-binding protein, partial [Rhizobium sp.]|nr:ABC transporter substrate-binding protein [Rhizobium sp.]